MVTATAGNWYEVRNAAAGVADVYLYGSIGFGGITAADFVRELKTIRASKINVYINSEGGSPFDAVTMHSALRRHSATVTTIADGLAASAASIVMMAGDKRVMGPSSQLMIHEASGLTLGQAADHEKTAAELERINMSIAAVYAARTGGSVSQWRETMRQEQWYTAGEALAAKLIDEIVVPSPAARQVLASLAQGSTPTLTDTEAAIARSMYGDKLPTGYAERIVAARRTNTPQTPTTGAHGLTDGERAAFHAIHPNTELTATIAGQLIAARK